MRFFEAINGEIGVERSDGTRLTVDGFETLTAKPRHYLYTVTAGYVYAGGTWDYFDGDWWNNVRPPADDYEDNGLREVRMRYGDLFIYDGVLCRITYGGLCRSVYGREYHLLPRQLVAPVGWLYGSFSHSNGSVHGDAWKSLPRGKRFRLWQRGAERPVLCVRTATGYVTNTLEVVDVSE